jgi:hypothetical protein
MYVSQAKMNSYTRDQYKKVGQLKAGWVHAALKFGAKIPAFVMRQVRRDGAYEIRYNKNKASGSLTSVNKVAWSKRRLVNTMERATRIRKAALQKYFERQVEIAANNWSKSKDG